jgi:hypothetical protein
MDNIFEYPIINRECPIINITYLFNLDIDNSLLDIDYFDSLAKIPQPTGNVQLSM